MFVGGFDNSHSNIEGRGVPFYVTPSLARSILVEVDDSVDVPDGLAEWLEDRCLKAEFGVVLEAGAFGPEAISRKVCGRWAATNS